MSKLKDSFLKANNFFKEEKFEEAKELYEGIVKSNPNLIRAWNNLGLSYIKLDNFTKAIEIITEALKIKPDNNSLLRNLGIAYYSAEEFEDAIKVFEKCQKNMPNNETLWCNIGGAHFQLGNHEEAVKAYKNALVLNDRHLYAWKNMCLAYSRMGVDFKYDDSRPNSEIAWHFLSKSLLISGLFEDALDACNQALRKNPSFRAAYIFRNKIRSMIREKKAVTIARVKALTRRTVGVKREVKQDDIYYQRFKKVQEKMHQYTKESVEQKEMSLEERFRLQQQKFRKRKMELEGIIEIEEIKPKTRSREKKKLIFIGNEYRNIEDCFFVVDGANVARTGLMPNKSGKISNLELLKKKLNLFGIRNFYIICDRALFYSIDDKETYSNMIQNEEIIEAPGGSDADNYILQIAKEKDAFVISNDMFRDKYEYFGKEWIKSKKITFKIIKQSLYFDKIYTVS